MLKKVFSLNMFFVIALIFVISGCGVDDDEKTVIVDPVIDDGTTGGGNPAIKQVEASGISPGTFVIDTDTQINGDVPAGVNLEVINGADLIIDGTMAGDIIAGIVIGDDFSVDLSKKSNVTLKGDFIGSSGPGFLDIDINGNLIADDTDFFNARVSVTDDMTFRNIEDTTIAGSVITVSGNATGIDVNGGARLRVFGASGQINDFLGGFLQLGAETNFTANDITSVDITGGNNITANEVSKTTLVRKSPPFAKPNEGGFFVARFGNDNNINVAEGDIVSTTSLGTNSIYITTGTTSEIRGLYSGFGNIFGGAAGGLAITDAHTNTNTDFVTGTVNISNPDVDTDPTLP